MTFRQVHMWLIAAAALVLGSCATPKNVTYLQDLKPGGYSNPQPVNESNALKARPDDKLVITVNSKDPQLAQIFNLSYTSTSSSTGAYGTDNILGYTVDGQGNIDFPILGKIHVAGLTRLGIANEIKRLLIERDLIKDPTIVVHFANQYFNVLGDAGAGQYRIVKDHTTILDALAMAHDLNLTGERENVMLVRTDTDGTRHVYRVDLTSAENLYASPAYYIQQDDLIYVEPSDTKKRSRSVVGNDLLTPSFWIGTVSSLLSLATIIITLTKK